MLAHFLLPQGISSNVSTDGVALITLGGSDVDDSTLTFSILTLPATGVLHQALPDGSIGAPVSVGQVGTGTSTQARVYYKASDTTGIANFAFCVSDGYATSAGAVVVVTTSHPTVAHDIVVNGGLGHTVKIHVDLTASDKDTAATELSMRVMTLPELGTLHQITDEDTVGEAVTLGSRVTSAANTVAFVPPADTEGSPVASFIFEASDQISSSNGTVSFNIFSPPSVSVAKLSLKLRLLLDFSPFSNAANRTLFEEHFTTDLANALVTSPYLITPVNYVSDGKTSVVVSFELLATSTSGPQSSSELENRFETAVNDKNSMLYSGKVTHAVDNTYVAPVPTSVPTTGDPETPTNQPTTAAPTAESPTLQPSSQTSAPTPAPSKGNRPTVALSRTVGTDQGDTVLIALTFTDSDTPKTGVWMTLIQAPAVGTIFQVNADGSVGPKLVPGAAISSAAHLVAYTPPAGADGMSLASFIFRATDGKSSSDGRITVNVYPPPSPTVAVVSVVMRLTASFSSIQAPEARCVCTYDLWALYSLKMRMLTHHGC